MLKDTKLVPDFPMQALVTLSEGASGSDLKEMCRNAAMVPVREYMRDHMSSVDQLAKTEDIKVIPKIFLLQYILNLPFFFLLSSGLQDTTYRTTRLPKIRRERNNGSSKLCAINKRCCPK